MKEKIVLMISFAVALTANLALATWTYDVQLVTDPGGLNVYAPVDEPFNISCEGEGGDDGKYAFMKWWNPEDNAIKEEGTPGVARKEKNILILTFTNPKIEDSGIYRCTATYDDEHNLEYLVNIHFHGPEPEFYTAFENVTAEEGTKFFQVNCSAEEGEKPITYSWYNQNEDMISEDTNKPIFAANRPNFSTLIIREVKNDHAGMYTCTANNTHGLTSKVYALNVLPSSDNDTNTSGIDVKVVNISATSVKFYISSKQIVWNFEVKYTEIREDNGSRTLLTPVSDNIYTISKLIPGGLYSFQFRTSQSDWSKVYRVILLPGVPELIFQNLESNSIKIQWPQMVDDIMRSTIDKYELKYYTVGMEGGNKWIPSSCAVTIQIPSCFGPRYTISGLQQRTYYQIEIRAHTESGYGEPARQKIYLSG